MSYICILLYKPCYQQPTIFFKDFQKIKIDKDKYKIFQYSYNIFINTVR